MDFNYNKIYEWLKKESKFEKNLPFSIIKVEEGYAKLAFTLSDNQLNCLGTAHGGAVFSMVDITAGVAASTYGKLVVTSGANINYLKAGESSPIIVEAVQVSCGEDLYVYDTKVYDGENNLLANAIVTMFMTKYPHPAFM